jgi:hypothetical protein
LFASIASLQKLAPCERSEQVSTRSLKASSRRKINSFDARKRIADFDIVKADLPVRTTG